MKRKEFKKESDFQHFVINEILDHFPDATVLKNDANYCQGIPDWIVIYKNKYAFLEMKISGQAPHQPNQDYYINKFNNDSFGAFVFPENKDIVLEKMYRYFLE